MKKTIILALTIFALSGSGNLVARNGDGTGPQGRGPQTGWGLGPCQQPNNNNLNPAYNNGRGFYGPGYGRGRGIGFDPRNNFIPGNGCGRGYGRGYQGYGQCYYNR